MGSSIPDTPYPQSHIAYQAVQKGGLVVAYLHMPADRSTGIFFGARHD